MLPVTMHSVARSPINPARAPLTSDVRKKGDLDADAAIRTSVRALHRQISERKHKISTKYAAHSRTKFRDTHSDGRRRPKPHTNANNVAHLVLVGNTVALTGDGYHLRAEGGGDELRRVVGGVRLSLDQGSYRRAVGAVQSLIITNFQTKHDTDVQM